MKRKKVLSDREVLSDFLDKLDERGLIGVVIVGKAGTNELCLSYKGYASQVGQLLRIGTDGIKNDLDDVGKAEFAIGYGLTPED